VCVCVYESVRQRDGPSAKDGLDGVIEDARAGGADGSVIDVHGEAHAANARARDRGRRQHHIKLEEGVAGRSSPTERQDKDGQVAARARVAR
jgi:hypothetical protein